MFVNALALAASAVATTDRQREFAALIAANDQDVYGLGMVGFDVSELPWSVEAFEEEKAFLLRVVAAAKAKTGWDRLRHAPPDDWFEPYVERLGRLIEAFAAEHMAGGAEDRWAYCRPDRWELCARHGVYKHRAGCVLCHDYGIED